MRCEHCGTRIENGEPFTHRGAHYCCECMSELTSWYLDGGILDNPDQFPEQADDVAVIELTAATSGETER